MGEGLTPAYPFLYTPLHVSIPIDCYRLTTVFFFIYASRKLRSGEVGRVGQNTVIIERRRYCAAVTCGILQLSECMIYELDE